MSDDAAMDPNQFLGDLDGYLKWREENPQPFNPMWCVKHWAPCPVQGRNGVGASIDLQRIGIERMPDEVRSGGVSAMNSWQENQTTPTCCQLGDEKMIEIWNRW